MTVRNCFAKKLSYRQSGVSLGSYRSGYDSGRIEVTFNHCHGVR